MVWLVGGCFEPGGDATTEGSESSATTGEDVSTSDSSSAEASTAADPTTSASASSDASSSEGSSSSTSVGEPPEPVELRWPWNGAATGSVWATDDTLAVPPRRPAFRWTTSTGASTYQIEIDDDPAFGSPEVDEVVADPTFTPADDLPVSTTAPVGRRYYWRVRACDGDLCSPDSPTRYVDVARMGDDYNGDGFADVALGAYLQDNPEVNEGSAYVYYGSVGGLPSSPSRVLDNPDDQQNGQFSVILSAPGDLNADGFGDLIATAYVQDHPESDEGVAYVYYGAATGLGETPSLTIDNPDDEAGAQFGIGVRGVGDVNADGFADAIIGAQYSDATTTDGGAAYLFLGSESGLPAEPSLTIPRPAEMGPAYFGQALGGGGDLDNDGYADAFISSYNGPGIAYLYRGGSEGLADDPDASFENPTGDGNGAFGTFAWIGDVNGDDFGDALIGAYLQDGIGTDEGHLFVYFGGTGSLAAAPDQTLTNPTDQDVGRFAEAGVMADVDADGVPEVILGAPRQDNPEYDEGAAFIFHCSAAGIDADPSIVLDNPLDQESGHMGVVGGPGDIDGDGYMDFVASPWRQDNPEADEGNAGIYFGSPAGVTGPVTLDNPLDQAGGHFGVPTGD